MDSWMENSYLLWECDSGVDCEGMCLASVEMSRDVISSGSTAFAPLLTTRRSNIVGLMMVNPSTDEFVALNMSANGTVTLKMPISGEVNLTAYSLEVCFECHKNTHCFY